MDIIEQMQIRTDAMRDNESWHGHVLANATV